MDRDFKQEEMDRKRRRIQKNGFMSIGDTGHHHQPLEEEGGLNLNLALSLHSMTPMVISPPQQELTASQIPPTEPMSPHLTASLPPLHPPPPPNDYNFPLNYNTYSNYGAYTTNTDLDPGQVGFAPAEVPRTRTRRTPNQAPRGGKSELIPAPFAWATTRRAKVHSLEYLLSNDIRKISGEVQCRKCDNRDLIEYDLEQEFREIQRYVAENINAMHDRAPRAWMNPDLPKCRFCEEENSTKPVISDKKKAINWLFLFLGRMLGCCTLDQLKYFCKHTKNHRTGAKDRVLYLTYVDMCRQLDPNAPI